MTVRTLCSRAALAIAEIVLIAGCSGNNGVAPRTPSTIALVSGDGQSGTVGQPLPQALVVRVIDASNAGVAGVVVYWTISGGAGSLSARSTQTNAQGQSSVTWTLGTIAGANRDSVTASVLSLSPVRFIASANPGPAAHLALVSGSGQSGLAGMNLPQAVVVAVEDQYGNGVAGATVAWSVTAGGGSVSASTGLTDGQGQDSVTWTLGSSLGENADSAQASVQGLSGSPLAFTANAWGALAYTDTAAFRRATGSLGTPTIANFDDINASPVNNSTAGRTPFDGTFYASKGFTFVSPGGYPLFIAPGGLSWNASNSLSVGRFPFQSDTVQAATDDADSLLVTLSPGCSAVSFEFVDIGIGANGTADPADSVRFFIVGDTVVQHSKFPVDYTAYRAFLGVVSAGPAITKILVAEKAHNGDDVDYDTFTCFP